jgi:hypothetical protein
MTIMISKTISRALVGAAAFLASSSAHAGVITGNVSDLTGGAISNTTVAAFDLDTRNVLQDAANKPIQTATDAKGNFTLTVPNTAIGLSFTNRPERVDVTLENVNGNLGGVINVFQPEAKNPVYPYCQVVPCAAGQHHHHFRWLKFWH